MTSVKQESSKTICVELNEEDLDQAGAAPAQRGALSSRTEPARRPRSGRIKFETDQAAP